MKVRVRLMEWLWPERVIRNTLVAMWPRAGRPPKWLTQGQPTPWSFAWLGFVLQIHPEKCVCHSCLRPHACNHQRECLDGENCERTGKCTREQRATNGDTHA